MQTSTTGINSYTGRAGNTWYYGSASVSNDSGTRSARAGGITFDRGSDGNIDSAVGGGVASGPRGTAGVVAAANHNGAVVAGGYQGTHAVHAGAAVAATNYETGRIWSSYR